jgi:hypothetical protein
MKDIYTEQELNELDYDKDKLREYFTGCATRMFKRANNMPAGNEKLKQMRCALSLFKYTDNLVESTYKGPKECTRQTQD